MILTYLDTSAVMRLVAREGDLTAVELTLQTAPVSSVLIAVELRAAICKRWHDGILTAEERDQLLALVEMSILPALTLLPLNDSVLSEANGVVAAHPVRTLDALHIATAIIAERRTRRHGATLQVCTADRRQADAAAAIFGGQHVIFVPPWR
jgi:predicted nucleic acid-binding protein